MAETESKIPVSYDESHVNIKLPNRCRRCHMYNEDPFAPNLRESFVIILLQMICTPSNACFLMCLILPYLALTSVSLMLLMMAGHYTIAMALFHTCVFIFLIWICIIRHFGRRYSKVYSTEHDLRTLNSAGVI